MSAPGLDEVLVKSLRLVMAAVLLVALTVMAQVQIVNRSINAGQTLTYK